MDLGSRGAHGENRVFMVTPPCMTGCCLPDLCIFDLCYTAGSGKNALEAVDLGGGLNVLGVDHKAAISVLCTVQE